MKLSRASTALVDDKTPTPKAVYTPLPGDKVAELKKEAAGSYPNQISEADLKLLRNLKGIAENHERLVHYFRTLYRFIQVERGSIIEVVCPLCGMTYPAHESVCPVTLIEAEADLKCRRGAGLSAIWQ